MELKLFRCLWGVDPVNEELFSALRHTGYEGIEYKGIAAATYPSFRNWLEDYDFDFISQIHTCGTTVEEHLDSFEALINASLPLHPILVNSQSGCDYWTLDEKCRFMEGALRVEEKYGLPVAHETHRSRINYLPWETTQLLEIFPEMKVCCDFSHWVTICERLLTTEDVYIEKALCAAIHLHARVGYEQGPQVSHPAAPEYQTHLNAHESWWERLWIKQLQKGKLFSTACPEYGPPFYQHTIPYSGIPLGDLPQITDWAMRRLRERFAVTINNHKKNKLHVTDK